MQRAGIIETSESPWASPVVMVPKKGGEWRFCVDYRRLNEVTSKDSYPLPLVDECLDLVAGSSWFSSFGAGGTKQGAATDQGGRAEAAP